ncbi:MAG: hypothetical protein ACC628_09445 [Pirellulaceae bacterium]
MRNLIRVLHQMEKNACESKSDRAEAFVRAFKKRQIRIRKWTERRPADDRDQDGPQEGDATVHS